MEWSGKNLSSAVRCRRNDIMWWLLQTLPEVPHDKSGALETAISRGDIPAAEWLISHGAEWTQHIEGNCPAHRAAAEGDLGVLKWLAEQQQVDGVVGLVVKAAEEGHLHVVRWLINRDMQEGDTRDALARSHLTDLGGEASLSIHIAAVNGHLDVAKYLRARAQVPTSNMHRALQATEQHHHLQKVSRQLGAWNKAAVVSGQSMAMAARNGFLDVVQWLYMEFGSDPDVDLFDYGAKRKQQTSIDTVAMDAAAFNGHLEVLPTRLTSPLPVAT